MSRHLAKLFDSLCKLKFRLDEEEKPLKFGLGMFSKEDEYVDFDQECDLSGQVSAGATSRVIGQWATAQRLSEEATRALAGVSPRPPQPVTPSIRQALGQLPYRISSTA